MLRRTCLVLGASVLVPALHVSAGDELLAVVVPAHRGDLDLAVHSITNWPQPTVCSPLTKANTDLVLYYAGGEEDAEAVAAAADTIAKTAGRCFAQTRMVFAELEKKVRPSFIRVISHLDGTYCPSHHAVTPFRFSSDD